MTTAKEAIRGKELLEAAVIWLRERLPPQWTVEISSRGEFPTAGDGRADAAIEIRSQGLYATIAVEARTSFGPRDIDRLLGSVGHVFRALAPNVQILIVAPWLSPRTREILASRGLNYIDQTGNGLVRLDNPAVFIQTKGADRDPSPTPRAKARVRGPKAWRLVRTLIDVRPPYGVGELAEATELAPGYVSRLLDSLDADALIERSKRGRAESVNVEGLLRRWSDSYDIFDSNETATFLAAEGAEATLSRLADADSTPRPAVTGSFAAVRLAAVARPSLLCVYSTNVTALANELKLIPADEGTNVALLRPFDQVVWRGAVEGEGVLYVAPSQVAVDCLTGNGRMPAEGEALMQWMLENEEEWRLASLEDLRRSQEVA